MEVDKLWKLLEMGIKDLLATEVAGMKIDMGKWLTECSCCLAGAVLYQKGFRDPVEYGPMESDHMTLINCPEGWQTKLEALDALRVGCIGSAIHKFYGKDTEWYMDTADYHQDREQFLKDMNEIVELLKRENL